MSARLEYTILGRLVGTASGWDQFSDWGMSLYDFDPVPGVAIPSCSSLYFDSETGLMEAYDDDDRSIWKADAVSVLKVVPRKDVAVKDDV